jgi:CheY-like chemotaxis protein
LVDDDPDIRESMSMVLQAEGYVVETAANGAEALEKLRVSPTPSLVLLDLMMPVMNGWRFLELVNGGRPADFPVVVVSAGVPPKPENAVSYLRKPVDLDALLATVAQYAQPA